jgi:hypothetical protein
MRRLKNPNQWPPGGWNFEEPSTGFRFRGSSLQELAAKVKLHREVNYLEREDRVEEDIEEQQIILNPSFSPSTGNPHKTSGVFPKALQSLQVGISVFLVGKSDFQSMASIW